MRTPNVRKTEASAAVDAAASRCTALRVGKTTNGTNVRTAARVAFGLGWLANLTLGLIFAVLGVFAGPLDAPMLESQTLFTWDTDGDGIEDIKYLGGVAALPTDDAIYNRVVFEVHASSGMRLLQPAQNRVPFQQSEPVGNGAVVYSNGNGGGVSDNWLPLLGYDEAQAFPGAFWRFYDKTVGLPATLTFFTNKTDLLIGFRFAAATGTHYGWFQFTRPEARFTNAFTLAAYDWNPLPGEPISAGQPPIIPVVPTVTPEGQLHLAWSAELTGWVLEATDRIVTGAKWEPVPDVSGTEALLVMPETSRFFRLRRP